MSVGLFLQDTNTYPIIDLELDDDGTGLSEDDSLESSIFLSLFSDARVTEEELPYPETDKRGWWGDMYPEVEGDKWGSKLWTKLREKHTDETLLAIEELATESLQWMIDDKVAESVNVEGEWTAKDFLALAVTITKPSGTNLKYQWYWDGQAVRSEE